MTSDPPVPANDFQALWAEVSDDVIGAVRRVGESGWFILGREVEAFEDALATHWGLDHAVGCANGMDAIEIALRALGLRPGDKVLTTPLSAFATTLAIVRAGGVPVFSDVDSAGLLDLERAEGAFEADPSIRFLVPVHLFGFALDLTRLAALKERYHLRVIEDCAQSIGATSHGRACGTVGDAAITSFYPTKNLGAIGDAGALLTRSESLAAEARTLRDYGQSAKYEHRVIGLNSRLDELQAAILRDAMLPRLDGWTARRRELAGRYQAGLGNPDIVPLAPPDGSESVWHLFPVLVSDGSRREAFLAFLKAHGILAGIHYPTLIPAQAAMREGGATTHGNLERAHTIAAREVSLPIHPFLTDAQVARVIGVCNSWEGC